MQVVTILRARAKQEEPYLEYIQGTPSVSRPTFEEVGLFIPGF